MYPIEILQNILLRVDDKTFVNCMLSNKTLFKTADSDYIYKKKCLKYKLINSNIKNWKTKYIQLHKNNCVECGAKTKLYNEFFYKKICRKCEIADPKYHCVSFTKAQREYLLSVNDLSNIKYVNKKNRFNSTYPLKLYLKSDIIKYISENQDEYECKRNSKILKNIAFYAKYNILYTILLLNYRVDMNTILGEINEYSRKLYSRYLRSSNCDAGKLIAFCLELDFVLNHTSLHWEDFDDFDSLLLYHTLFCRRFPPTDLNSYIKNKFKNLIAHKDKIRRKQEILQEFPDESLTIPMIYDYIYKNKHSIKYIKAHLTLERFLNKNTEIVNIIMYNIINNINPSTQNMYIYALNSWYNKHISQRHLLPKILYQFLI